MTAASCSPAVASRRAKYVDDFQVQTLLVARTYTQLFSDGCTGFDSAVQEGRAACSSHAEYKKNRFSPAAVSAESAPVVRDFLSKLRAPHRGTSLGLFVREAKN
jgi:hypothetical protein